MAYAGYLFIGALASYIGTGRFVAGLLLGGLFARVPWISQGRLRTVGLLPQRARLPVMVSLLTLCLLSFLYSGEMVHALFLGFAVIFLISGYWAKKAVLSRVFTTLFKSPVESIRPKSTDDKVIDVEFHEKK